MSETHRRRQKNLARKVGLEVAGLPTLVQGRIHLFTKEQQTRFVQFYGLDLMGRVIADPANVRFGSNGADYVREAIGSMLVTIWQQDQLPKPSDVRNQSFKDYCTVRRTYRAFEGSILEWSQVKKIVRLLDTTPMPDQGEMSSVGMSVVDVTEKTAGELLEIRGIIPRHVFIIRLLLREEGLSLRKE